MFRRWDWSRPSTKAVLLLWAFQIRDLASAATRHRDGYPVKPPKRVERLIDQPLSRRPE